VPAFDFGRVHFFQREPDASLPPPLGLPTEQREELLKGRVRYKLLSAELNMDTGSWTSTPEARRGFVDPDLYAAAWDDGHKVATITRTVYPCRAHQFFAVQSFKVAVEPDALGDACFFHDIGAPSRCLSQESAQVTFSSPVIFSEGASTVMFTADAAAMSVACAYTWTEAATSFSPQFAVMGYNVPVALDADYGPLPTAARRSVAFNKVDMRAPETLEEGRGHEFRFQIISCTMSARDALDPAADVRRALLRVTALDNPPARLRTEHVRAWDDLWRTDASIVPKLGISETATARIRAMKRALRYAMYTLHSLTRSREEDRGVWSIADAGSSVSGVVDLRGTSVAQADVWLLPALVLLKPRVARRVIDSRHARLEQARTAAAMLGKPGAYFRFGRADAAYPFLSLSASSSRFRVFNTALAASNAWDYYRSSLDSEWLRGVGAPLIHAASDFLRSCFSKSRTDGKYVLEASLGLDDFAFPHNSFAVNSCMLAFRAAIECSYVLRLPVKRAWMEVVQGVRTIYLRHETLNPSLKWVYRKHDEHAILENADLALTSDPQVGASGHSPWVHLADPLFILTPSQAQVSHPNGKNLALATANNLAFYEPRLWLRSRFE